MSIPEPHEACFTVARRPCDSNCADRERSPLPSSPSCLARRTLLTQCLAFEPGRRPQRGAELDDLLDDLLRRWELPGRLPVACGPGQLEYLVGTRDPIWILHDGG